LDLIVMKEVLDHGNNFDDWSNIYGSPVNSIGIHSNFNDPY
jgi:hypothetical protein